MERPRVVVGVSASVDGKIALTREQRLAVQPSARLWADMVRLGIDNLQEDILDAARRRCGCSAVLEGSRSLVDDDSDGLALPLYVGDPSDLLAHHLPEHVVRQPSPPHMWFTTVDGRGRVRWTEDHPDWDILVLVCRATPTEYLAYLRREGICYLVAGGERVDLAAALTAMAVELDVSCVLSTAGGALNGALVRAGLVDEVVLTIAPALIGGADTPTVLDGPGLAVGEPPVRLRLLSVVSDGGGVRLHYEVVRDGDGGVAGAGAGVN